MIEIIDRLLLAVATQVLPAAEREWIRRQGMTARALADEKRRILARTSTRRDEVERVRELLDRDTRRFTRR